VDSLRAGRYGDVGSLLVARHGVLVLDEYFGIDYRDELVPLASATKSFTSALIGLAVDGGLVAGPGAALHSLLPGYADLFAADSTKRPITLEHVLTMTTGLDWDESWPPALEPADSGDLVRLVLRQPLVDQPGTRFRYSTGGTLILSAVLLQAYGISAEQTAVRRLFGPLGINSYLWTTDSTGLTPTGSGLSLRARDMAKLGQLYLDGGLFRSRRVLSEGWVAGSTTPHSTPAGGYGYGYLWWLFPDTTVTGEGATAGGFFASGAGDKYVIVLPRLDIVVVVTAYNNTSIIDPLDFVIAEILPAVQGR